MRSENWWAGVRAVVFDAAGTLITPDPPAQRVYADIGRQYGTRHDLATIQSRFRAAFAAEEEADRAAGWRTDEAREERRWRAVVAAVLDDVVDREACFRELYAHFARPAAWRCDPAAERVLSEMVRRGLTVAIASNFDHRLRSIAAGLPALAEVSHLVISSEVGWRKPARPFFDAVVRAVACGPNDVLLIGDDFDSDYAGATAAGLRAVLLDPHQHRTDVKRIENLIEFLDG